MAAAVVVSVQVPVVEILQVPELAVSPEPTIVTLVNVPALDHDGVDAPWPRDPQKVSDQKGVVLEKRSGIRVVGNVAVISRKPIKPLKRRTVDAELHAVSWDGSY